MNQMVLQYSFPESVEQFRSGSAVPSVCRGPDDIPDCSTRVRPTVDLFIFLGPITPLDNITKRSLLTRHCRCCRRRFGVVVALGVVVEVVTGLVETLRR